MIAQIWLGGLPPNPPLRDEACPPNLLRQEIFRGCRSRFALPEWGSGPGLVSL